MPDFQSLMRPLLASLQDGDERSIKAVRAALADKFELSEQDLEEKIPSGRAKTFQNRVGWATTYLLRTGLLERPKRGSYRISDRGREVLEKNPDRVDLKVLSQFQEFHDFRQSAPAAPKDNGGEREDEVDENQTPEERVDAAHLELRRALVADLLDRIQDQSPDFFEQLVLDVLRAMGYGGRSGDSATRLGKSGDEGVDGVIREDELGLDLIYVQAKKWQNVVGRPEIQKFYGALHGQRATKGIFITTSSYSKEAMDYAQSVTPLRIILIDGRELARLMIDFGVGVAVMRAYELKRVDLDYFVTDEEVEPATQPEPVV